MTPASPHRATTGFAGVLALDGRPLGPAVEPTLEAMGRAIAHRGLAARELVRRGPLALVRAPVRGADGAGADLLCATDGITPRAVVEGYRALGSSALGGATLGGRFALALWDAPRATLVLARDPHGKVPLFHARVASADGDLLLFGSELKALLAHPLCPRTLDWTAALAEEAMPRKVFAPTTFFAGLERVPPGGRVEAASGRVEVVLGQRPTPRAQGADDPRSDADVIAELREVFIAAVDDALGPDPERTGLMLSGGIDSVSIAAVAARRVRIPTFTVLSQSTFGNGDAALARQAAELLGLDNHQVVFRWDEPMRPDAWRRLVWQCESPECGPQHYYKLQLARRAAEVRPELARLLNGEGSDELMGADFRNHGEERDDATFEDYLADLAEKQRIDLHTLETFAIESRLGRPIQSRAALARASRRPLPAHAWHQRLRYCLDGLEQEVMARDDRLASGFGLASDTPYLDPRVVDLVTRIPQRLYGPLFWQKRLLREAMVGLVPEPLRLAKKTPFFAGVDGSFTSRMLWAMLMADDRALVREALDDGAHPELAPGLVDLLVSEGEADPQRGVALTLLSLVNLGLLEKMAADAGHRPGPVDAIPALPALTSADPWDAAEIVKQLSRPAVEIGADTVLAFAPGVELVLRDRADAATPTWYIVVNDAVRYVLDEEDTRAWCEVLRHVDGRRSLGAIVAELGLDLAALKKHADEALAFDVVVAV